MRWDGDPQQVDTDQLRDQLGDEAFQSVQNMKDIASELEEAGYIMKTTDGLQLTPTRDAQDRPEGVARHFFLHQAGSPGRP